MLYYLHDIPLGRSVVVDVVVVVAQQLPVVAVPVADAPHTHYAMCCGVVEGCLYLLVDVTRRLHRPILWCLHGHKDEGNSHLCERRKTDCNLRIIQDTPAGLKRHTVLLSIDAAC